MREELFQYYERELTYLRHLGTEFGEKYPGPAGQLRLQGGKSEDPHVERLLEGFAFLAARVHLRIDDDFPEITEALLSILYPHYLRPIPSMSVVQFHLDPDQAVAAAGTRIPAGTPLISKKVGGVPCQFRTCYDTTLWPFDVVAAEWKTPDRLTPPVLVRDAAGALRLELRSSPDAPFSKLRMNSLRFYLDGKDNVSNTIYEILLSRATQVIIRDPTPNSKLRPVTLPASAIKAVGFGENEGMLPYPRRSFTGYRLLQEYFAFPQKYFFIDFQGLNEAWSTEFRERLEIVVLVGSYEHRDRKQMLELSITSTTFRTGCSPIVNLFPLTAEPILVNQRKYEYQVIPDVRRPNATEIFSVDEVVSIDPRTRHETTYQPFYSYRHATSREKQETFWIARRRPSERRNDEGTEISLSLVDLSSRPVLPDADTLTIRTTCTNRDLPARLPFGADESGDFELEISSPVRGIVALKPPTAPLRPDTGGAVFWRLISHLSLNYLSLVSDGREALQEILKLYNFTRETQVQRQIEGIAGLTSDRHFARVISDHGIHFSRGTKVNIEFDEEMFAGGGTYLFASVLERFLGQYASINSFSQLTARSHQRKEVTWEWPPRAGQKQLL